MKLRKIITKYAPRMILGSALLLITPYFVGCSSYQETSPEINIRKKSHISKNQNTYYFTDWGIIDKIKLNYYGVGDSPLLDDLEMRLGDMDGDGDLDIVVASAKMGLRIYENKIPQKHYKNQKIENGNN